MNPSLNASKKTVQIFVAKHGGWKTKTIFQKKFPKEWEILFDAGLVDTYFKSPGRIVTGEKEDGGPTLEDALKRAESFVEANGNWKNRTLFRNSFQREWKILSLAGLVDDFFTGPTVTQALRIAKTVKSRSELHRLFNAHYELLRDKGLLDSVLPAIPKKTGADARKYTLVESISLAKQAKSRGVLLRMRPGAYATLRDHGKLDELLPSKHPKKMTLEEAITLASSSQYKGRARTVLKLGNQPAYTRLDEAGLLDELFPLRYKRAEGHTERRNLEYIKAYCDLQGKVKCIDTLYLNARHKLKFQCLFCDLKFEALWGNVRTGHSHKCHASKKT